MFLDFILKEISSNFGWLSFFLIFMILCILIGILLYIWIVESENQKIKFLISMVLSPVLASFVIGLSYFFSI